MKRIVLLDGDIPCYSIAAAIERPIKWSDDIWTLHAREDDAIEGMERFIDSLIDKMKADEVIITLTDRENPNFRLSVLPTYKQNRSDKRSPMLRRFLHEYLIEKHDAQVRPALEGDDLLGILATNARPRGHKIVVSIDKDMATIPGFHYRWKFDQFFGDAADGKIVSVDPDEADYWWLYQTLTGDQTDGYSGCPGVGPKGAEKILAPFRGGEVDLMGAWALVVAAYEKAGLNADVALQQARVARILRSSDYDFKKKEPILWSPS